jgi:tetratricopeptide (TPR) repeat protein
MKTRLFTWITFCVIMMTGFAFAHGDLHDRITQITEELLESPSAALFFKRGSLHLEHGEAGAALADFNEADKLAPGAFETDVPRAEACMLLGQYPQALDVLSRCLARDPSASRCLVLRARVLGRMGKPDDAIRDYRKAVAITPQPEPDLLLEVSTALAENKQPAAALEVLDQGIARLGQLPSLVNPAIEIELGKGNVAAALQRIDVAQHASPRPEPWMARRASVLARAGRTAESRVAWKSLLDHISSLPPAERSSHAMCARAREASDALAALKSNKP